MVGTDAHNKLCMSRIMYKSEYSAIPADLDALNPEMITLDSFLS